MTAPKSLVLLPLAEQDIYEAMEYYRSQGGATLSIKWASEIETTLRRLTENPSAGSPRYGNVLKLQNLRHWKIPGFPYILFYCDGTNQIDIWRVLHGRRDIPTWLQSGDEA